MLPYPRHDLHEVSIILANLDAGTKIVGRGATMLRDGDRIAVAGAGGPGGAGGAKGAGKRGEGQNKGGGGGKKDASTG